MAHPSVPKNNFTQAIKRTVVLTDLTDRPWRRLKVRSHPGPGRAKSPNSGSYKI